MSFVIAIDGPAASGKGTLARRLAAHLGLPHLDTGLLYRGVAMRLVDDGIPLTDGEAAERAARLLDVGHLTDSRLRGRHMGEAASVVSSYGPVRDALLAFQRRFALQASGAVLDGRDIGTIVCPDAAIKLHVTADPAERARRRFLELQRSGEDARMEDVLADIRRRDDRDRSRATAPLVVADDAIILDTTKLDEEEAFRRALAVVRRATPKRA